MNETGLDKKNLIDAKTAAEMCGVKRVTIYKWAAENKLEHVEFFGRILFTEEQISKYLKTKKEA